MDWLAGIRTEMTMTPRAADAAVQADKGTNGPHVLPGEAFVPPIDVIRDRPLTFRRAQLLSNGFTMVTEPNVWPGCRSSE